MSGYISRYFNVQGGLNLFHGGAVNSDAVDFTFIHVINNVVIRHWGFPSAQRGRSQLSLLCPLLRTADRLTPPGCSVTASSLDGFQMMWRLCCERGVFNSSPVAVESQQGALIESDYIHHNAEFGWWISVASRFRLSLGGCLVTFWVYFCSKCLVEQWPRDECRKMTPTLLSWVSLISFFLWPSLPWIIDLVRCGKLITWDYVEHEY